MTKKGRKMLEPYAKSLYHWSYVIFSAQVRTCTYYFKLDGAAINLHKTLSLIYITDSF